VKNKKVEKKEKIEKKQNIIIDLITSKCKYCAYKADCTNASTIFAANNPLLVTVLLDLVRVSSELYETAKNLRNNRYTRR
jgi:hypothetical protein